MKTKKQLSIGEIESIKYTFWKKFKLLFCSFKHKSNKEAYQKIYEEAQQKVEQELNLLFIIQTLSKIKATLTVLVGDD